jgi:hypothetical protein
MEDLIIPVPVPGVPVVYPKSRKSAGFGFPTTCPGHGAGLPRTGASPSGHVGYCTWCSNDKKKVKFQRKENFQSKMLKSKKLAMSITAWMCVPERGMKDFEVLCRASAFIVKAKPFTWKHDISVSCILGALLLRTIIISLTIIILLL